MKMTRTGLLTLPSEVRLMIYPLCLEQDPEWKITYRQIKKGTYQFTLEKICRRVPATSGIFQTCKTIQEEAAELLASQSLLRFFTHRGGYTTNSYTRTEVLVDPLPRFAPLYRDRIRKIACHPNMFDLLELDLLPQLEHVQLEIGRKHSWWFQPIRADHIIGIMVCMDPNSWHSVAHDFRDDFSIEYWTERRTEYQNIAHERGLTVSLHETWYCENDEKCVVKCDMASDTILSREFHHNGTMILGEAAFLDHQAALTSQPRPHETKFEAIRTILFSCAYPEVSRTRWEDIPKLEDLLVAASVTSDLSYDDITARFEAIVDSQNERQP